MLATTKNIVMNTFIVSLYRQNEVKIKVFIINVMHGSRDYHLGEFNLVSFDLTNDIARVYFCNLPRGND